jgi:RimJ/RimL family protein N-acetyltransferase
MTRDDRPVGFVCTAESFVPARGPRIQAVRAVRWLGPADYPLVLEAWRLRGGSPTRDEWDTTWPAEGYRFAGIVSEGRLVSVAAALTWKPPSPTSWELAGVWTREDARNRGLATAVCSFVTDHILENGRTATCHTTRSRPAMIRVAERLGFQRSAA